MLVWNREKSHHFLSPTERKRHICRMATSGEAKVLNAMSLLINFVVPVFLYFYFGLDLILFGICFIAIDIFLNLFEQIAFITIPYWKSKSKNPKYVEKRIKKLESGKKEFSGKLIN